jgi:phosphatidylinositol-3-phosphatase
MLRKLASLAAFLTLSLMVPSGTTAHAATRLEGVPTFGHVFLIVGENTSLSELNKTNAPYQLGWVRHNSAWLTDYWAISHYSTSNYIAMTSGQFLPCHQADEKPATCNQDVNNLFNQLDGAGVSWLEWNESMPKPCYLVNAGASKDGASYRVKHNPAVYYANIEGGDFSGTQGVSSECLNNVIAMGGTSFNDTSDFDTALQFGDVADFNYIVPNQCEDAHDNCKPQGSNIRQFDDFLQREIPQILESPAWGPDDLIFVVYDEGGGKSPNNTDKFAGGNPPFAVIGGPVHDAVYTDFANHYSLLRTLEDGYGISEHLEAADIAATLGNIWN